jgi:hypothetical protein
MPLAKCRMNCASVNGPARVARTATAVAAAVVGSSMTGRFTDEVETGG